MLVAAVPAGSRNSRPSVEVGKSCYFSEMPTSELRGVASFITTVIMTTTVIMSHKMDVRFGCVAKCFTFTKEFELSLILLYLTKEP